MDTEERAFLQGKVIQKLDDLTGSVTEMREDFRLYRLETNNNIKKNSLDIARAKGWMGVIALIAGIVGGFLRSFFGR
jgi:hypothetical protein